MANIHILKNTNSEAVLKVYTTESSGDTIEIDLETVLTAPTQTYVTGANDSSEVDGHFATYTGSHVFISGLFWGLKKDKQLDVTRLLVPATQNDPAVYHGHYYLINGGDYDFKQHGFVDRVYADKNIVLIFDGAGHCIIKLDKIGWANHHQPDTYGIYDDETTATS